MRADLLLVEKHLSQSRQKAKELIETGAVSADGEIVKKASQNLSHNAVIVVNSPLQTWVSRGALKLLSGLEAFPQIPIKDKIAVDLGASTGGFTQVLLSKDVGHVFAIDVGHGQLSPKIAKSVRVTNIEKTNARHLSREVVPEAFQLIVSDVSFISLTLALPPAMEMADQGAYLLALIKPQFEVGRSGLDKGGVVKDDALRQEAVARIASFVSARGWDVFGTCQSAITGPDGNIEYMICAQKR